MLLVLLPAPSPECAPEFLSIAVEEVRSGDLLSAAKWVHLSLVVSRSLRTPSTQAPNAVKSESAPSFRRAAFH